MKTVNLICRDDGGGGDVVLGLNLLGRGEVFPQPKGAPGAVLGKTDAQVLGDETLTMIDQFISGAAVDEVDTKAGGPIAIFFPVGLVKSLDDEDEVAHGAGNGGEPLVIFVGVCGILREKSNDRAKGSGGAKQRAAFLPWFVGVLITISEVSVNEFKGGFEVFLEVADDDRARDHGVGERFGNLRLATAGNGAGFMAKGALGIGSDQPPALALRGFHHLDLVAGGENVGDAGLE